MSADAEQLLGAIFSRHDLEALKMYIAKGYDVCAQMHQNTLLHEAACLIESALEPEVALIGVLLKRGADIHAECSRKMTALHCAARSGNAAVVQILLDAGASVAAVCREGETPLSLACTYGHLEVNALL
jgi:ankyrin repeat protein